MDGTAAYYKDDFAQAFMTEEEQQQFLEEREKNAQWRRIQTKDVEFQAIDNSLPGQLIQQSYINSGKQGLLEDTLTNTKLLLKAEDKVYPVRNCAISTILSRARISGPALGRVDKSVLANILNECVKVTKGFALLRFSDEKLSAMHGGDESEYAILEAPMLFRALTNRLNANFEDCQFVGGHFDHSLITATWEFPQNTELIDAYGEALQKHGLHVGSFTPAVRFLTSDVGMSGANLYPLLISKGRSITLGSPLILEHKHGASLQKFEEQLDMLYPRYLTAIDQLCKLMDVEVVYPYNAMLRVMKRISIGKKIAYEIAQDWQDRNGTCCSTAHELYLAIGEATFLAQRDGASAARVMQIEENVSRALKIKWGDYDYAGEINW